MDSVIFSPPAHTHKEDEDGFNMFCEFLQADKCVLTVCRQVVDQRGQEGNEHAGDDDVDHIEERFASDDQVEGDVLMLVALHGNVFVGVSLCGSVDDLPLTILCWSSAQEKTQSSDTSKHFQLQFRFMTLSVCLELQPV